MSGCPAASFFAQAPTPSAVVQVTALGNPKLLERVSNGVLVLRNLFKQFDTDDNNVVSRDEFAQVSSPILPLPVVRLSLEHRVIFSRFGPPNYQGCPNAVADTQAIKI